MLILHKFALRGCLPDELNRTLARRVGSLFLLVLLLLPFQGLYAETRLIDEISLSENETGGEIQVRFTQPLRYVSHAPLEKGRVVTIRLKRVVSPTQSVPESDRPEKVSVNGRPALPLLEAHLDLSIPGSPELVLTFERTVAFNVSGGSDGRSVVVAIKGETPAAAEAPKKPEPVELPEQVTSNRERYAINLLWTTDPINVEALPALDKMSRHRLYISRYMAGDVLWYRLRLGFFDSRKEGEGFLESIRSNYKSAFVTQLAPGEEERSVREARPIPAKPSEKAAPPPSGTTPEEPAPSDAIVADAGTQLNYVVNLASSLEPFTAEKVPDLEAFGGYRLYTTTFSLEGTRWHRLRLGFFPTREAAVLHMAGVGKDYPQAWVSRVSRKEREESANRILKAGPPSAPFHGPEGAVLVETEKAPTEIAEPPPGTAESEEKLAARMEEARVAMANGDYRRAIQLYTKVMTSANPKFDPDALEYLGLARERNGQMAHAVAEYQRYLKLYPETEGAVRVQQRLDGLLLAQAPAKEKLKGEVSERSRKEVRGSFSQFYTYDESYEDELGVMTNRSALSSDLDITGRVRTQRFDTQARFTGGYENNFLRRGEDEASISALYIDAAGWENRVAGRVGRQSQSTGGVLGRFDGAHLGFQLFSRLRLNLVGGYPVSSSTKTSVETEKGFYGVNMDIGTFLEHWDFNIYAVEQTADGIQDRRAVGGEVRYFHPRRSFFGLVDYDVLFDELNTGLVLGTLVFEDRSTINISLDYRRSPVLTTSNALQGQLTDSLRSLNDIYDDSTLRKLARDRSPISRSASLGVSKPVTEKLQLSGDATISEIGDSRASGGVEAVEGTGIEYSVSFQVTGSSLIKEGDIGIVDLRYFEGHTHKTYSLNLNTRYPVNRAWRINPRVRLDYRLNDRDAGEEISVRPSLRTDYRLGRHLRFELEGGGEWSNEDLPGDTRVSTNYYVTSGYRWDF